MKLTDRQQKRAAIAWKILRTLWRWLCKPQKTSKDKNETL